MVMPGSRNRNVASQARSVLLQRQEEEKGGSLMSLEDAFLADILEHPDDDTPRLVYADWLDEHGQAERAEFIRVQCELERMPEGNPTRLALEDRAAELERGWAPTWARLVRRYA